MILKRCYSVDWGLFLTCITVYGIIQYFFLRNEERTFLRCNMLRQRGFVILLIRLTAVYAEPDLSYFFLKQESTLYRFLK